MKSTLAAIPEGTDLFSMVGHYHYTETEFA
jgi:hypothetical protein